MNTSFTRHYSPLALVTVLLLPAANSHAAGETTFVSVDSEGQQGNEGSFNPSISADGRYVAFESAATDLVPGDTNQATDVFVHDRTTSATTRVSVSSTGAEGSGYSTYSSISADGRSVTFTSHADNLVPGDSNAAHDIFVHDRTAHITTRVSVSSTGAQANLDSYSSAISADGRYVVFQSGADNLVPGDTNAMSDIFVHDRLTGKTRRVSVNSAGMQGNNLSIYDPAISADGRYVVFASAADNLVPGDTNEAWDVFVHDRTTEITTRVSVSSAGKQGNNISYSAKISADGRYVAFASAAQNLDPGEPKPSATDVFVHDRQTHETARVSVNSAGRQVDGGGINPAISADGRYVAFWSGADSLVPGDTNKAADVFIHNRTTGKTSRVSVDSVGQQGNASSFVPSISADGRYVAFASRADNLVPQDANGKEDVFVHDRLLNTTQSTDLQVSVTNQPASVQTGEVARYLFTVTNNGLETAGFVTLIDGVSGGKVWSLTPSQGGCKIATLSVCRLRSLEAGESATVRAVFKANGDPLSQQVSVSAAPVESNPDNNRVTVSTPVTP